MNAFKRLHGLILEPPGLDSSTPPAGGGRDRTMNRPHPRRRRAVTARRRPPRTGLARPTEAPLVNPPLNDPDVRHELVARVRREIEAGTYETPEKMEAALARMLEWWDRP